MYATHLFTTPLSNVICDNMMSELILTLTKQVFDDQLTHFTIKTYATIFAIFHNRCSFFSTSYFSSEKNPGAVKIVSHILKSLFYFKNCQNFKFR